MEKRSNPDVPAANGGSQPKKSRTAAPASPPPPTSRSVSLPDDLVAEVPQRLPSRSLARLRCVCRSWNDFISSDGFVERYPQEAGEPTRHGPTKLVLAPLAKRHANPSMALCAMTYSMCNPPTGGLLHVPPPVVREQRGNPVPRAN